MTEHGAGTAILDLIEGMNLQEKTGDFSKPLYVEPNTEAGQFASKYNDIIDRVLIKEIEVKHLTKIKNLILDSAGEGIYGLDLNGNTTFCNPAAAKMIGYDIEELIGKPQHAILHHSKPDGSHYPREECPIYAAFKDGEVHHVSDEVFWRKDGSSFPVEYVSTPIRESGVLKGAVVTFQDITDRKQADEIINEQIGELEHLTYSASHDLQEPLRKVIMFSERLAESFSSHMNENDRLYIDRMQKSCFRMKAMIDDLLGYSRLVHLGYDYEQINLTKLIEEIIDDMELNMEESKAHIQFDNLPHFQGDKIRMHQLFQNLISNSIKYCKPDTVPEIIIRSSEGENGDIKIFVEDNGIGFNEKYLKNIFKPFRRLHSKDQYEGTGMGLFICQKIVAGHGGTITATSCPHNGSTFIITLPPKQSELN